jgi:putative pyruvate formate lyase activating enzyme
MEKCLICPWECKVDREKKLGVCKAPNKFEVSSWQIHYWEEPFISGQHPIRGSGTIFFTHCNLRCVYCQNYEISQLYHGMILTEEKFLEICLELKGKGAYNINLVSPTPYSNLLKKFLEKYKEKINLPIIWNSNGYEKKETIESLNGLVDVWLPDLKYFDDKIASKYSGAKNYFKFASEAILTMRKISPQDIFNQEGLIEKGLVIRHLVLPNQTEDSLKILKWIKENLGEKTLISLMSQYYPTFQAFKYPEINRRLEKKEYQILVEWLIKNNFENVLIQDLSSANKKFTPDFKFKF